MVLQLVSRSRWKNGLSRNSLCYTQTRDSQGNLEGYKERPRVLYCEICAVDYECWHSSALEESLDLLEVTELRGSCEGAFLPITLVFVTMLIVSFLRIKRNMLLVRLWTTDLHILSPSAQSVVHHITVYSSNACLSNLSKYSLVSTSSVVCTFPLQNLLWGIETWEA